MKICTKCGEGKTLESFGRHGQYRDGLRAWCKSCVNAYQKRHRREHPERYSIIARRARFKRVYGISLEAFDRMFAAQDGKCAICGTDEPGDWGVMHVDHDHATGQVRALLCGLCNKGLGCFRDNRERLRSAIEYLDSHEEFLTDNVREA